MQEEYGKRIDRAEEEAMQLLSSLYLMAGAGNDPDVYGKFSLEAALRAEKLACSLRHLVYDTTEVKKREYLPLAGDAQGIEIRMQGGMFQIRIPRLLPKRRNRKSVEYLLDPLQGCLEAYAEKNGYPKYRECVICIIHTYSRENPVSRIYDYDNLEWKQVLDVLASFLLVDDSGLLCDVYHTTESGAQDETRIILMEKIMFPDWLKSRKEGHF